VSSIQQIHNMEADRFVAQTSATRRAPPAARGDDLAATG